MRPQRASDAGPITIPLRKMVQIRRSSASLSAITKGTQRHQTGSANTTVTRKIKRSVPARKNPAPVKRRLKSRVKRVTARSKEAKANAPQRVHQVAGARYHLPLGK